MVWQVEDIGVDILVQKEKVEREKESSVPCKLH